LVDHSLRGVDHSGRPRHRVVCNLGRKDLLAPHAEALRHLLKGEEPVKVKSSEAKALGAWDWGVMRVARHFWQELGLEEILIVWPRAGRERGELADRVTHRWLPLILVSSQRAFNGRLV
jgi:hypothetical protein